MGLARVNLTAKRFDFWAIGPAVQLPVGARPVSFSLAPDRKRAYGLLQEIGRYEFWTFDLERRNLVKTEFDGRPRMALRTSTNGKLLYVYQAGNTIDLYDAATYKYPPHDDARHRRNDRSLRRSQPSRAARRLPRSRREAAADRDEVHPRSARSGSVRDARHAGTKQATSDAAAMTMAADANARGSRGLTRYKR